MIIDEIKSIKSGKTDLRKFGLTVGIVLALIASYLLLKKKDTYQILYAIASAFIGLGLLLPIVLKPIQKVWMTLAILMGWVMTRVILTITFYVIFTPIGLIARLFGKDFINKKWDVKASDSYWVKRETMPEKARYENQF